MPLMSRNEDGTYSIQLNLHAGNVFRYNTRSVTDTSMLNVT